MGEILGRISLAGKLIEEAVFQRAFERLRPARCARCDLLVERHAAYGNHDRGLNRHPPLPQPLRHGPLTLLADARLDQRRELAQSLGLAAQEFCDAGLILHAYRRWGQDCLQRLYGDFAFAVHDSAGREVFLARDHVGVRPLYWTKRGGEVMFASLIRGLVGLDGLAWSLSESRIGRFLCHPDEIRPETFIEGVESVEPGCWVRVSETGTASQRWWDPMLVRCDSAISELDAHAGLLDLTERAVKVRLPDAAAVGAHFSGGLDSTLVSMVASKLLRGSGRSLAALYAWCPPVSADYPDMGKRDERHLITAQARRLGVTARYGSASVETIESLLARPMELEGTANLLDELPIIEQASEDGVGVMLSGWGGDEVLSNQGQGHLAWLLRHGRLGPVLRQARRRGGGLRRPHRMARTIWKDVIVPMLPDWLHRHFNPFSALYRDGAYPSEYARRLDQQLEQNPPLRMVADADAFTRQLLLHGHLGERMATWAAWSAPSGFEYRYPLTDRRLLEFVLALPPEIRFGNGAGRYLFRRAFANLLPKGVKKADPANEARRHNDRLAWMRGLAEQAERGRFRKDCPWLDMRAMADAVRRTPPTERLPNVKVFAPLFVALRVYEMHRRQPSASLD